MDLTTGVCSSGFHYEFSEGLAVFRVASMLLMVCYMCSWIMANVFLVTLETDLIVIHLVPCRTPTI